MNELSAMNVFQSFQNLIEYINLVHFFQDIGSIIIEIDQYPTIECKSASINSKTKYKSFLFLDFITRYSFTIFSWFNCLKIETSRYVLCASIELRNASNTFLSANLLFVRFYYTSHTCPYAPLPIYLNKAYSLSTCNSTSFDILFQKIFY